MCNCDCSIKPAEPLCDCCFTDGKVDICKYLSHMKLLKNLCRKFSYTTISEPEPNRRICKIATCLQCGRPYCQSIAPIQSYLTGSALLATAYIQFYEDIRLEDYETIPCNSLDAEFINLFDDKDKAFVNEWLKQLKPQT